MEDKDTKSCNIKWRQFAVYTLCALCIFVLHQKDKDSDHVRIAGKLLLYPALPSPSASSDLEEMSIMLPYHNEIISIKELDETHCTSLL